MAWELAKAIYDKATSDAALSVAISDASLGLKYKIYLDEAPQEVIGKEPYIIFYVIGISNAPVFNAANDVTDNLIQFTIVDNTKYTSANISTLRDKLDNAFNRKALVYDTHTQVGCLREVESGPQTTDDGWIWTVDYRIQYQK